MRLSLAAIYCHSSHHSAVGKSTQESADDVTSGGSSTHGTMVRFQLDADVHHNPRKHVVVFEMMLFGAYVRTRCTYFTMLCHNVQYVRT